MQQTVVDVDEDAEVADRNGLGRVERLQFGDMANHQDIARRLGQGEVGKADG